MPLVYLDQNAVIKLGFKAKHHSSREKLDEAIAAKSITFVVSMWHLIETAHTPKLENAVALAKFIDSLQPMWLLERRDIQRIEVAEDFFRFSKIEYEPAPRITSRIAAIASLNKETPSARHDIPSETFVTQWIKHPEQLEPLEKPYRDNEKSVRGLRELAKAGKLTEEVKQEVNLRLFEMTMPSRTRQGLEIGKDAKEAYVAQAKLECIPSFAIEHAIFEHQLTAKGGEDRNTLIDKVHLISAVPYADEIVSDDKFFAELYPFIQKTGHVKANLVGVEALLAKF